MKDTKHIDEEYVRKEAKKTSERDLSKVLDNQAKIEDKILNSGMFEKYAELGKLMFKMLRDYYKGTYKSVPWFTISSIVFVLIYVLNPIDIVPDFIPGLGYIDDLTVFTIGLRFIETDLHNYLDWKLDEEDQTP